MNTQLRRLALFACITATTALGSQLAFAATPAATDQPTASGQLQPHHQRGHHFLKRLAKQLGLSGQQKSQAGAILKSSRAENKPLMLALMNEKHQMRELMLSGSADEAAIRAQSAKVAAVQSDLAVKRAQEAKQLLALLTPEQVRKLRSILDQREQRFRKYRSGEEAPL